MKFPRQKKSLKIAASKFYGNVVINCSEFCRLVILIVVYFVAGMIIMRVKYEKTGTDIIPNKGFWFSLPSLVKVRNLKNVICM